MGERAGSRGGRLAARSAAVDTQVSNFAGMACCARIADLRGRRLGCDQAGGRPDPRVLRGRRGPV